ncbi:HTH_Tnp_Tc3_2 domain-containing protein [Trichonephila clavipes]|nr:HTH_Tnp_Tc3_2 domain-containing protein [Trichonephila clavipes]
MIFTVAEEGKESFSCSYILLRVMQRVADLSEFDRRQIVMLRRLGTGISKTVRLVSFLLSAIFSICVKWINDDEISSRHLTVGCPLIIKDKGRQRLSRLVKQNQHLAVGQLTAQYNAGRRTSISEHAIPGKLLDMGLYLLCSPLSPLCISADQMLL